MEAEKGGGGGGGGKTCKYNRLVLYIAHTSAAKVFIGDFGSND